MTASDRGLRPENRRRLGAAIGLAARAAPGVLAARVLLALLAAAVPVLAAWLLKVVLDRVVATDAPVLGPVLLLGGSGVTMALVPEVARYADGELRRRVGLAARQRLYAAVGRLEGLRSLENPRFHDRLLLAADSGPASPADVVSQALGAAAAVASALGFVAAMATINPWMLLVVLVAALPTVRAELVLSRHRAQLLAHLSRSARREFFYAQLMTSLTAAKEVRLYGLSGLFGARMLAELRRNQAGHRRMDRRELAVQCGQGVLGAVVAGAGLAWAATAARAGTISVGDVSVFVAALAGVQSGVTTASTNISRAHEALLLFDHFRFVTQAPADLVTTAPARTVTGLRQGIELDDVWFRYADDLPWVLRGVSLTIPAGRTVALVGRNGAGKSTLVHLLCRFYDPTRGAIRWDGVDLRDLPPAELRRRLGVVFQDFMTYDLSAGENIGLGDLARLSDRPAIVAAARLAGVHDTLAALPEGYDTLLTRIYVDGDDPDAGSGVRLSGGQWQRVALARALLRDQADLLILDEPSAGLDAAAEAEIAESLRAFRAGRTSLLISHRLNTIRDADLIVVLRDGVVVESGTHDALMASGGEYADLFARQAAGYREVA